MTNPSTSAIHFDQVSRYFGEVKAVDHVDLEIRDGEFFSMLGPSGSGKTTCLRMIAGFDRPTSGHIHLYGQDVSDLPPYERDVNTVFQDYALFPHMTVGDNIAYGLMIKGLGKAERMKRVAEMLDLVRLPGFGARKPSQLSGGQRQRVALARALINHPKVLLLDEPLGALDLKLRQQMQVELKSIQQRVGITFIFVTHDQEEALTMSDRIAVMRTGQLEQVGTPEQIYDTPDTAFVARFIGSANMIPVTIEGNHGDTVQLKLPGARLCDVATAGRSFPTGEAALLMVRPEDLKLACDAPSEGAVGLPVTLTDMVFQGAAVRCSLLDAESNELVIFLEEDEQQPEFRPGASLWLSWRPSSARLLHKETS
jgi:spermidine/putrescine ABC transporter ATP-binding subunit